MKRDIEHFEIQPVLSPALTDAARFLASRLPNENSAVIERRLCWLFLENPLMRDESRCGYCIRDASGDMRGLNLCFPSSFLAGEQRLAGLGSGSYFVDPEARSLGFYLFKKYLSSRDHAFFFATTCNTNSAPLWERLGGSAVPGSQREYMLPLRLDSLLPALLSEKCSNEAAGKMVSLLGRCANPIVQFPNRRSPDLTVSPCQDWQKLSDLFRRHRSPDRITTDRSAKFLRWRYGHSSDPYPAGVYLVRDQRGREGWFALGYSVRGRYRQLRGFVLLDAVWPREHINFTQIFASMLPLVAGEADAIWFRPQYGVDLGTCSRWIVPVKRSAPSTYLITRRGHQIIDVNSLDLTPADGDSALPISPVLVRSEAAGACAQAVLQPQR